MIRKVLPIMLTIGPRIINKFWVCSQSLLDTSFLVSALRATPNHMPLKYRYAIKISQTQLDLLTLVEAQDVLKLSFDALSWI